MGGGHGSCRFVGQDYDEIPQPLDIRPPEKRRYWMEKLHVETRKAKAISRTTPPVVATDSLRPQLAHQKCTHLSGICSITVYGVEGRRPPKNNTIAFAQGRIVSCGSILANDW
jgi:hypothetical protein